MPRNPEKNALLRENRKKQILDATLNIYIRFGFHGTDIDTVAEEAGLAKGLIYYYYKTKKELFAELYIRMFDNAYSFSETLLKNAEGLNPVEQLMLYAYGMFMANKDNPRFMQFNIRIPFDAYAIFGPDLWKDGVQKSDMHRRALAEIIEKGISCGIIPYVNPNSAANSFWSVFVANVFEYSRLMAGTQKPSENEASVFKDVVRFCFQGLGVDYTVWNSCLEQIIRGNQEGGQIGEDI